MNINRIAIIGIGGSGKSVVGRQIAELVKLTLIHMDQLFWKGNWEAVSENEYVAQHAKLIQKEQWIIEGYIDELMAARLERADLIIYLDYSGILCAWRIIRRWLAHRKESRPELPKEALEHFHINFFLRILFRKERERIEGAIQIIKPGNLIRLHAPAELEKFIQVTYSQK